MPDYELHADYDRDGRMTSSAFEYGQRTTGVGAIIMPNLDIDSRRLPVKAINGPLPRLDYERYTSSGDDDYERIRIIKRQNTAPPGSSFYLRCLELHPRIAIFDDSGNILHHLLGRPAYYVLPDLNALDRLDLAINARTIPGGLFDQVRDLNLNYQPSQRDESHFRLELICIAPDGTEIVLDAGNFTISPFILTDRTQPCRQIFMCKDDQNLPSIQDVQLALRQNSNAPPLVIIPDSVSPNDIWIQDQYQHAFLRGPGRKFQELVLHLPRMRQNMNLTSGTPNLASFVNGYYASANVGLFSELWTRSFAVKSLDNQPFRFRFIDTMAIIEMLDQTFNLTDRINSNAQRMDRNWVTTFRDNWQSARIGLPELVSRFRELITARLPNVATESERQILRRMQSSFDDALTLIRSSTQVTQGSEDRVVVSFSGSSATLHRDTINRLYDKFNQIHNSSNYGGNIESTPPTPDARLGKIIIGNVQFPDDRGEFMDPDVVHILASQKKQPIVEIDTTWLRVGHVDEILSIVPRQIGDPNFGIVTASPRVAMALLRKAEEKYISGLPTDHPLTGGIPRQLYPFSPYSRFMTEGSHPVTRMFRGKSWRHVHHRNSMSAPLEPPGIYQSMAYGYLGIYDSASTSMFSNVFDIGFIPGPGEDRNYPADMSVIEALWSESDAHGVSVNDFVDSALIQPTREILTRNFPSNRQYEIPVLFDTAPNVADWEQDHFSHQVSAISPDMANLQYVNGQVLIPKPYGPRMLEADAIEIVQQVMREFGYSGIASRVGSRMIARNRMKSEFYWVEKFDKAILMSGSGGIVITSYGGLTTKNDVITLFKDSFPGATTAQLERNIIRPNLRHFDRAGNLKDNFNRFIITDNMVDLFELYARAVFDEIGVQVNFVDTWRYHVLEGQIHCGTNVLTSNNLGNLPAFWDLPDIQFRSTQRGSAPVL